MYESLKSLRSTTFYGCKKKIFDKGGSLSLSVFPDLGFIGFVGFWYIYNYLVYDFDYLGLWFIK